MAEGRPRPRDNGNTPASGQGKPETGGDDNPAAVQLVRNLPATGTAGGNEMLPRILAAAALACGASLAQPAHAAGSFNFKMVRTQGLPEGCAEHASASVHVDTTPGFAEKLVITVKGFRPGTPLVLCAIQEPNAPFRIGWYEGDVAIGAKGSVTETFVSRFNIETFATAIGQERASKTPKAAATKNPIFKPIHTYHLGIWFDSVEAAVANGCPPNPTVFNGDHTAGPQVLNTGTFPDLNGPLARID